MKTILKDYETETIIKKSKFLSFAISINSEEMAEQVIEKFRNKFRDATHVVYAYVLSRPVKEKCSDDGEPSGTAGKPVLEVIKKNDLTNILIIIVRYFGGVKLGAGGLVAGSAKDVIEICETCKLEYGRKYTAVIAYEMLYQLQHSNDYKIINIDYSDIANKKIKIDLISRNEKSNEMLMGLAYNYQDFGEEVF